MGNFHKKKSFLRAVSPKSPIFHQIHPSTFLPKSKPKFSSFQALFIVPLPKIQDLPYAVLAPGHPKGRPYRARRIF